MGPAAALSLLGLAVLCASNPALARPQTPPAPSDRPAPPAAGRPDERDARAELPPRVAIGGVRLLETTSTVTFAGVDAPPHTLIATLAFPARARLLLSASAADGGPETRELRYRAGESVFALGARETASQELSGAARLEVLRDLELRSALFLWPDGVEWKGNGAAREAGRGALGTLRAHLEPGRAEPTRMELLDAEGRVLLAAREVAWVRERERSWPAAFEWWREGRLALREKVETRDTTRSYVDAYFLPPDRREGALEQDRMIGVVRDQELPAFAARRVELPRGLDWTAARAAIERLTREWTEALRPAGLALEANRTVELGERLEPRALLVRLAQVPEKLPDGFVLTPARRGKVLFVAGLERVAEVDRTQLGKGLPEKARLHPLYLRIPAREGPVLVVQPWSAQD